MAGTAAKIHVGAGYLYLNPDDAGSIDLGFCSDGATLTYNAALEPITVDQVLAPVGYFVPGEECKFETILSELSAEKFAYAIGKDGRSTGDGGDVTVTAAGAAVKGSSKVEFGGQYLLTDYVLEYQAAKRNAANLFIKVRLLKVNVSPEIETAFTKDGKSGIKFIAMAVADTTQDAGKQLGYYLEETADLTGTTPTLAVSSSDPADESAAHPIDDPIVITFNRDVDATSIHLGNFILIDEVTGEGVTCTVARTDTDEVTLTPSANLTTSQKYVCVVAKDVRARDDKTEMSDNEYIEFTTA